MARRPWAGAGTMGVLALAFFFGCSPPATDAGAPDVSVGCRIEPSPPVTGPARIELTLTDAQARPVSAERLGLLADMDHPGMAPVLADARPVGPGTWEAELGFTMAGDWFLLVDATLTDGRRLERRLDVRGVRSP